MLSVDIRLYTHFVAFQLITDVLEFTRQNREILISGIWARFGWCQGISKANHVTYVVCLWTLRGSSTISYQTD